METNKDVRSFGLVLMDVGKLMKGRECISTAVLQNGKGQKVHLWQLADGEVIIVQQDCNAPKAVIKATEVFAHGSTSWVGFKIGEGSFEAVLQKIQKRGFNLCKMGNFKLQSNVQLSLDVASVH